jgi:hypothetical protein
MSHDDALLASHADMLHEVERMRPPILRLAYASSQLELACDELLRAVWSAPEALDYGPEALRAVHERCARALSIYAKALESVQELVESDGWV